MMLNLFSMFDPLVFYKTITWVPLVLLHFGVLIVGTFYSQSGLELVISLGLSAVKSEIQMNLDNKQLYNVEELISLFIMIFFLNIIGDFTYEYAPTATTPMALVLGYVWWAWYSMPGLFMSPKKYISHLVPGGTPFILIPLMVLIETLSVLIRPVTLSVRLMANIMAGHLIVSLVCLMAPNMSLVAIPMLVITGGIYLFELGVALVQAYVFITLVSLYSSESR